MADAATTTGRDALFDPFALGNNADRHAVFAAFRSRNGFASGVPPYPELEEATYLFSADLVHKSLKHPFLLQAPPGAYQSVRQQITQHSAMAVLSQSVLLSDPPRHAALRQPLRRLFSRPRVLELEAFLRDMARGLMTTCLKNGAFDLTQDFATPFVIGALSRVLGLPIDDPWELKRHTAALSQALEVRDEPVSDAADVACDAILSMIDDGLRRRAACNAPQLIDAMLSLVDAGEWSRDDLMANCLLFLFAGQETVVDTIGNAVTSLHRFADQRSILASQPELANRTVEEVIRFEPAVHFAGARIAAQPLSLGDLEVAEGEAVVPVLAAANRDPAVFRDPNRLDITRQPRPHASFGTGPHTCLGIHLARLEARVALEVLYQEMPEWQLVEQPAVPRDGILFRGYTSIPAVSRQ